MENLKSIETDLCTSVITGSQNSPVMSGCGRLARLHRKNNLFQRKGIHGTAWYPAILSAAFIAKTAS